MIYPLYIFNTDSNIIPKKLTKLVPNMEYKQDADGIGITGSGV
jgi:hypothetical protein